MATLTVQVLDESTNRRHKACLPDSISVDHLLKMLVKKLGYPSVSPFGELLNYGLYHEEADKPLSAWQVLADTGIESGDTLRLQFPTQAVPSDARIHPKEMRLPASALAVQPSDSNWTIGRHRNLGTQEQMTSTTNLLVPANLYEVAIAHRHLLWTAFAQIGLIVLLALFPNTTEFGQILVGLLAMGVLFATAWSASEVLITLNKSDPWLWLALLAVPCVGLAVVIYLVCEAGNRMRQQGVNMGVLGATQKDVRRATGISEGRSRMWVEPSLCGQRATIITVASFLSLVVVARSAVEADRSASAIEAHHVVPAPAPVVDPLAQQRAATLAYWRRARQLASTDHPKEFAKYIQSHERVAAELRNLPVVGVDRLAVDYVLDLSTLYDRIAAIGTRATNPFAWLEWSVGGANGDPYAGVREMTAVEREIRTEIHRLQLRAATVRAELSISYGIEFPAIDPNQ